SDETYNKLFTMHGVMMVFFCLIPAIPSVLGNFLVPIMIGAKDLAFPKLNLASWYIYMIGGLFTLYALIHGVVDDECHPDGARDFHHRFLVHPHRPELHRHDAQDARAGDDMVSHAAV